MDSQFERFKKYMDSPCTELHEKDAGRGDPHRLAFQEWGVPQEFLLWLWQAAEAGYETSVEAEDVPSCWPITPTHWMHLPAAPVERGGE